MNKKTLTAQVLKEGYPASLQEILDARERRVQRQQAFLQKNRTLISFTLNIAGNIKTAPLFEQAFEEGVNRIVEQLHRSRCDIESKQEYREPWGYEFYAVTPTDAIKIKKLMVEIEEGCPIGRFFDIDVMTTELPKVSRKDIGEKGRKCLLCDDMGAVCARSQRHALSEIQEKTIEMLSDFFAEKFARNVASNACRALLYEVGVSPKPGLVDRFNNGSHRDMDIFTFFDSIAVLTPYFHDLVRQGIELSNLSAEKLLPHLRYPGKEAEESMRKITHGVNTHKGIIFSLGIFCAAFGWCYVRKISSDTESVFDVVKNICSTLMDDFKNIGEQTVSSGESLYQKYGITGIRGQAIKGFLEVREVGFPVLKQLLCKGFSYNDAGALTLLHLICSTEDTNIISRSDPETLKEVQLQIQDSLHEMEGNMERIASLDHHFIEKNISPGGCADLLSLTWFLYFMEQDSI